MASVSTQFEELVATWPAPVQLKRGNGDAFVSFFYHPEFIEAEWMGHITAEDVIQTAKLYLALLQKTPVARLLNNKAAVSGDWEEANDWLEFEWLPDAIASGLRCMAHVYSENVFSKLSATEMHQRFISSISMRTFHSKDTAIQWLLSCTFLRNIG